MYLRNLTVTNIRALDRFEMSFPEQPAGWHVIIGDNGAGKSTLIRAIALGLIGPNEVKAARPVFGEWLRRGTTAGAVTLTLAPDAVYDRPKAQPNEPSPEPAATYTATVTLTDVPQPRYRPTAARLVEAESEATVPGWTSAPGWFSASFGPFRRFTGGNRAWEEVYAASPRCGAHLTAFGEDVALTEALDWLRQLDLDLLSARQQALQAVLSKAGVESLEELHQRALADPEKELSALLEVVQALHGKALYTEAELVGRQCVEVAEKGSTDGHPQLVEALNKLAMVLVEKDRLVEAEPLLRRALMICENMYGHTNSTIAMLINGLAIVLYRTGRLNEAEPLMRQALTIDESSFGPEHPNLAIRLNNLGVVLRGMKRLAEAEPLLRRALVVSESSLGPEHTDVASRLSNLALLLADTKRQKEAERLLRRALTIDESSRGPDHPMVASRLNNLALLLRKTNRLVEAEKLARRALVIGESSLGLDHPHVAKYLDNLARLLEATDRAAEGQPLRLRAHAIKEARAKTNNLPPPTAWRPLAKRVTEPGESEVLADPEDRPLSLSEASLGNRLRAFLNESGLLEGVQLYHITAEGSVFHDANGSEVPVTQLSDGFRSVLSLTFELIRQLVRVYGQQAVFPAHGARDRILVPGVVLIDEVDAHLHPTWQTRIGQWFTKCFPNLQFIVTTHSPLVCRAVTAERGSVWRLPAPGKGQTAEQVTGLDLDRLRFGTVLDAYGTGLFGGADVEQSAEASNLLAERARLDAKDLTGKATPEERARLHYLNQLFTWADAPVTI